MRNARRMNMESEKSNTHVIESKLFGIKIGISGSLIDDCKAKIGELTDDNLVVYVGLDHYIVVDFPDDKKAIMWNNIELRRRAVPSIGEYKGKSVYMCEKRIQF